MIWPVPDRGIRESAEMTTEEITNRLKRIEGQVRGLQRMVAQEQECEAILTQLMATRAALDRVGLLVAENFVRQCLMTVDGELARQRIGRVLTLLLSRFSTSSEHPSAFEIPFNSVEEN